MLLAIVMLVGKIGQKTVISQYDRAAVLCSCGEGPKYKNICHWFEGCLWQHCFLFQVQVDGRRTEAPEDHSSVIKFSQHPVNYTMINHDNISEVPRRRLAVDRRPEQGDGGEQVPWSTTTWPSTRGSLTASLRLVVTRYWSWTTFPMLIDFN